MSNARINNYIKNSDFTTVMQRGRHVVNLTIPAGNYGFVTPIQTDFAVSEEAHLENVVIESSLYAGEKYPTNYAVLDLLEYYIYLAVYQVAIGQYRFSAIVVCPGGSATLSASTATATINLAVSPFV